MEVWLNEETISLASHGLRMLADFGTKDEVLGAAQIAKELSYRGIRNDLVFESLRYWLRKRGTSEQGNEIARIVSQCAPQVADDWTEISRRIPHKVQLI